MASKGKLVKGGSSGALPRVDSSAPTCMIAPEDYEHLYAAGKGKEKAVKVVKEVKGQSDSLAAAGASDAPTALIAPQDYAHIFCAEPTIKKKLPPKKAESRMPSVLIDAKQNAKSNVGKAEAKAKGKPNASSGGRGHGSSHSSTKPTASKAASSSSHKETSSKHEKDEGDEEGSGFMEFAPNGDLASDNILLDENWNAKVTDFGFAVESVNEEGYTILRKTFCGTTPYYDPQLALKKPYDPFKADVFASGVVLYAMLHNKFPFHFSDTKSMAKEQNDIEYKTSKLDKRLSKEVKNLILQLFEPEESNRPTFEQVLQHNWILKHKKD
ncbi:protein serine threonine kinase [Tyrophagus putrescentiae]|nr:protein serine threonine kinase [Tyrophagus putrescentiae]